VENRTVKSGKAGPGFRLPVPAPGLYVLDVRGRGCRPLQVPVLLDEQGIKGLVLTPAPEKAQGEATPSPDPKYAKLASLFAAQQAREAAYRKAVKDRIAAKKGGTAGTGPLDWTSDLTALAADLTQEADPDVQALAAACYLELHMMMADIDPETASLALDKLPAESPWWAFNPRSARGGFTAAGRGEAWSAFIEALAQGNPDKEVRAYGVYSQAAAAYRKGDRGKFDPLAKALATDYKNTKFGRSAKVFDPAKMPPPSATEEPNPEEAPEP
ncbi:MAG TPA: hypothetical protein VN436_01865, partial [Holophaga sp.]|nr:hypothetical protein [Holophaga sp.]